MSKAANILKWAGSKSQSAHILMPFLDSDRTYIEPFCGSATFFFAGSFAFSHLNDSNASLMGFYRGVASSPEEVWNIYDAIEVSESRYYSVRESFNALDEGVEKAAFFLYLNHFCFNGIYRTNKKGKFNTPFGAKKKIRRKTTLNELRAFSEQLSNATLSCLDFEDFLDQLSPINACIYMDPPYFTGDNRVFGEYGAKTFGSDDLIRLLGICNKLRFRNKIVVSYRDCTEFRELFAENVSAEIQVRRNVGGFAGRRKTDGELVAVFQ